jgi:hypothetical protein
MRILLATLLVATAGVAALAAPTEPNIAPQVTLEQRLAKPPISPPVVRDADRDGYDSVFDCNDDDSAVNPSAVELANGIDDDCNGVVDDGFDTSADWPELTQPHALWPAAGALIPGQMLPLDGQPRLVWTGSNFLAVWADLNSSLRIARIAPDGTLMDASPLRLRGYAKAPDIAWTGTRLAIVYQDVSMKVTPVRLMILDPTGLAMSDVVIASSGSEPKIAWGQDRFGIVWKTPFCAGDCLRFQRFDRDGLSLSDEEILPTSGRNASITFSGTGIRLAPGVIDVHEGTFGIVYEAYYGLKVTGDVLLTSRARDPWGIVAETVKVNEHADSYTPLGAMPAIAGNSCGFAVSWHVLETEGDRSCTRFFCAETLTPVQEFPPDADAGRSGRIAWTGSEFVATNDNMVSTTPGGLDVHFRRLDASGNSHLADAWGPWSEVHVRTLLPGTASSHPDLANTGSSFGLVWVEGDDALPGYGRLWFATVAHK